MNIDVSFEMGQIRDEFVNLAILLGEPCAIYKPQLSIDGNQWCALYGENLQNGVAGFGDSPSEAMQDFNKNWYQKLQDTGAVK